MIEVKVIADSVSSVTGARLTTLECTFHRFILPEFNTYRMFSRSAASSRAIPTKRRIQEVRNNPALPMRFGKNQKGMVAEEELTGEDLREARATWYEASQAAADYAEILSGLDVAKEITNRVLEPFAWHTSVVTAEWEAYQHCFNQRIPKDAGAQTEFQMLAILMQDSLMQSTPQPLDVGEWHLPYITEEELEIDLKVLKKLSVARVARTSYLSDKIFNLESNIQLYDRLVSDGHWAPLEMVATPAEPFETTKGNFQYFVQLRHLGGLL